MQKDYGSYIDNSKDIQVGSNTINTGQ
jgi:hypothetical protein